MKTKIMIGVVFILLGVFAILGLRTKTLANMRNHITEPASSSTTVSFLEKKGQ